MDTDCGMPTFWACREWSLARIDALVPHFRDGPYKARRSGLHIDVHLRQTCVECEERLKPRQAGFFLAADRAFMHTCAPMDAPEHLRIAGLTGVELTLPIAGPGSRSYAFVIDWHIRVLLTAAWMLIVWLLLMAFGLLGVGRGWHGLFALTGVLPGLLIYFLYHPVLELLMHGRTPGKRTAGVRLVTRTGGLPSAAAILTRNIFRILDSMPFMYLVGLSSCMLSAQRLRIGDMAAGTVLVLEAADATQKLASLPALLAQTGLEPDVLELLNELLERWLSLSVEHRDALGRALLVRATPSLSSASLIDIGDAELQQRLRALLAATT
jgi:uncharacterized RDD family membrane protein YckC